jgi:hypothetical protein
LFSAYTEEKNADLSEGGIIVDYFASKSRDKCRHCAFNNTEGCWCGHIILKNKIEIDVIARSESHTISIRFFWSKQGYFEKITSIFYKTWLKVVRWGKAYDPNNRKIEVESFDKPRLGTDFSALKHFSEVLYRKTLFSLDNLILIEKNKISIVSHSPLSRVSMGAISNFQYQQILSW